MWLVPLFVVIVCCHGMSVADLASEWKEFKLEYEKYYESRTEEEFRMKMFSENKFKIAKHNAEYESGKHTYKLGMNRFGDLLEHEIYEMMYGYHVNETELSMEGSTYITPANADIPDEIDWNVIGVVTDVEDQGDCGSSYAFSATGAIESQYYFKVGYLVSLSEQNIIDCSDKNFGCNGGYTKRVYDYVRENGGIEADDSYPYTASQFMCKYSPSFSAATVSGYVTLPKGDEDTLKEAVAIKGPVSVSIDAKRHDFIFYKEGIYCNEFCSDKHLNHAVLNVGYGTDGSQDYWTVKNSWGEKWGVNGYMKMCRNHNNNCGIASQAIYPLI